MNLEETPDASILATLWIGSPRSVSEHSLLCQWLISHTQRRFGSPGPLVMFENVMMPVEEIVEAFSTDEGFFDAAVSEAHKKGIAEASMGILLFSVSESSCHASGPNAELVYVGTFPYPSEDLPPNN